jgi:hypothetical protein
MSHIRTALGRLAAAISLLPRAFTPPPEPASAILVRQLQAQDAATPPPLQDLEALRRRLQLFYTGQSRQPPTRREMRYAVWLLWNGSPQGAAIPGLMQDVLAAAAGSPWRIRLLIAAWLRDFAPGSDTVRAGGAAIRRLLDNTPDSALDRWRAAQARYAMFTADAGPQRIGTALLHGPQEVKDILAATGLDDPAHASGDYMRAVLRSLLAMLPQALRSDAGEFALQRAFTVLAPDGRLRFDRELRGDVGRGLLAAWLDGGPPPQESLRAAVSTFLLDHLGDPRTKAPQWLPVGERETALMRQWLARASLAAFFDIIADHALDHQWRYRQAFWTAYLERGAIADAWLALGRDVFFSASTVRDLADGYGRLTGGQGNQSVLLLRIGPLILCEWSHNGSLRAWPAAEDNAPAMYQPSYTRQELMRPGLLFPPNPTTGSKGSTDGFGLHHMGAERGLWQGRAAELIARYAGIRLTPAEWMPA